MTTLTVHIEDANQDAAIRTLLDALHVRYEDNNGMDETDYLNSTPANREHLDKSTAQALRGEGVKINPITLLPE